MIKALQIDEGDRKIVEEGRNNLIKRLRAGKPGRRYRRLTIF
jgi:hypothetical protein